MLTLVLIIHLIVSFILMIIILLQSGSSADLASAFGGMSSQTSMGRHSKGNALTKITAVSAVIFMFTSLALAVMMSKKSKGESVVAGMGEIPVATKKSTKTSTSRPLNSANKVNEKKEKSGFKTETTSGGKVIKVKKLTKEQVKELLGEKSSSTKSGKNKTNKGKKKAPQNKK